MKASKPHTARRAFFHEYCAPGYYLITSTMTEEASKKMKLSSLDVDIHIRMASTDKEMIIPDLSPLGESIRKELMVLPDFHPEFEIKRFVIMPDHIHYVLQVKQRLKRKLGQELASFYGACSRHYSRMIGATEKIETLFLRFDDEIIFDFEQLQRAIRYVETNPLRYIIKKRRPRLFEKYLHLDLGGREYAAYGNIFLLRKPYLLPIRVHRKWKDYQFKEYMDYCRKEIDKGAIPISPAIHPIEKKIITGAIEAGSAVIKLTDMGMPDRFSPHGDDFYLCAEGRLLLIAPWPDNPSRHLKSGYTEFHDMNDMAMSISHLSSRYFILKGI